MNENLPLPIPFEKVNRIRKLTDSNHPELSDSDIREIAQREDSSVNLVIEHLQEFLEPPIPKLAKHL
jgi:hypothetical protein